jgi:hypothetical protein
VAAVIFPVSGVEVNPIIPPLVAFLVSSMTAPAGVSGAFLLLPFQMSVLNFTSPAVSPTKLIYNMRLYPEPSGIYRGGSGLGRHPDYFGGWGGFLLPAGFHPGGRKYT